MSVGSRGRCLEWFDKWEKEPNFCGLGSASARYVGKYMMFVKTFSKKYDIHPDIIYLNLSSSAAKHLLQLKEDSPLRKEVKDKIAHKLKAEKKAVKQKLVDFYIGMEPKRPPEPLKIPNRIVMYGNMPIILNNVEGGELKKKISLLTTLLTEGQMEILYDLQKCTELSDEYGALCLGFIWIKERLEHEKLKITEVIEHGNP